MKESLAFWIYVIWGYRPNILWILCTLFYEIYWSALCYFTHTHTLFHQNVYFYVCICIYFCSLHRICTVWQRCELFKQARLLVKVRHMLVLRNTLNIAKSHQVSTLSCLIWKSVSKYNKYIFTWKAQIIFFKIHSFSFFFLFFSLKLVNENAIWIQHIRWNVKFCTRCSI